MRIALALVLTLAGCAAVEDEPLILEFPEIRLESAYAELPKPPDYGLYANPIPIPRAR